MYLITSVTYDLILFINTINHCLFRGHWLSIKLYKCPEITFKYGNTHAICVEQARQGYETQQQ